MLQLFEGCKNFAYPRAILSREFQLKIFQNAILKNSYNN